MNFFRTLATPSPRTITPSRRLSLKAPYSTNLKSEPRNQNFKVLLYIRKKIPRNEITFSKEFDSARYPSITKCRKEVLGFLRKWHSKEVLDKDFQIFNAFFAEKRSDRLKFSTKNFDNRVYEIEVYGNKNSMTTDEKNIPTNSELTVKKVYKVVKSRFGGYEKTFSYKTANTWWPNDRMLHAFFKSRNFSSVTDGSTKLGVERTYYLGPKE